MHAKRFVSLVALVALATTTTATAAASSSLAVRTQRHLRLASSASSSSATDTDTIVTTAALADAVATATPPAQSTREPVVSVWRDDDPCSASTQRAGCLFAPTCSLCLTRAGCAIEASTGRCVSIDRIPIATVASTTTTTSPSRASSASGDRNPINAAYIKSDNATYCGATDAACAMCQSGDSDAPCVGASNCVCLRQCELQATAPPLECLSALSFTAGAYVGMAVAVLCMASIAYQVRRLRRARALSRGRLVQRRRTRPAAATAASHPLALKLDNWQKDRSEHCKRDDAALGVIELRSCYLQMHGDDDYSHRDSSSQRATEVMGTGSVCSDLDGSERAMPQ